MSNRQERARSRGSISATANQTWRDPDEDEDSDDYFGMEDNYYDLFAQREKIRAGKVQVDITHRSPRPSPAAAPVVRITAPPKSTSPVERTPVRRKSSLQTRVLRSPNVTGRAMSIGQYSKSPPERWDELDFNQRFEPLKRELAQGKTVEQQRVHYQLEKEQQQQQRLSFSASSSMSLSDEDFDSSAASTPQPQRAPQPQPRQSVISELKPPSSVLMAFREQRAPSVPKLVITGSTPTVESAQPAALMQQLQRRQSQASQKPQFHLPLQQQQPQKPRTVFDDVSDDEDFQHGVHDQSLFDTLLSKGATNTRRVEKALSRSRVSPTETKQTRRVSTAATASAQRRQSIGSTAAREPMRAGDFDMRAMYERLSSSNMKTPATVKHQSQPQRRRPSSASHGLSSQQPTLQKTRMNSEPMNTSDLVWHAPTAPTAATKARSTSVPRASVLSMGTARRPSSALQRTQLEPTAEDTQWQFAAKRAEKESRRLARMLAESQTENAALRRELDYMRSQQGALQRLETRLAQAHVDEQERALRKVAEIEERQQRELFAKLRIQQ
eukprot:TRINITY_DN14444_c0_g1_i1.p1 TRINITY_DN14444_c0_g1~~TRINITY_DN14444_c0_g1_i1.p1  ORF type:complete len:555 (+),score=117.87 TRINITY_DN14444_c0_g1_i1:61-1725(+)